LNQFAILASIGLSTLQPPTKSLHFIETQQATFGTACSQSIA
jgi:hypothetical protein